MLPTMTDTRPDTPFLAVQTEARYDDAFEIERSIIEPAGGRVVVQRAANQRERATLLRDAQCVLVSSAPITNDLLDQLPNLQLIVRYGVGLDTLDIPAATAHGVVVAHYPDFCQPEVANHATMLLLAVARKLVEHDRSIREGRYREVPLGVSAPIFGETMGIVALGNIGQQFATRAKASVVIRLSPCHRAPECPRHRRTPRPHDRSERGAAPCGTSTRSGAGAAAWRLRPIKAASRRAP